MGGLGLPPVGLLPMEDLTRKVVSSRPHQVASRAHRARLEVPEVR